MGYFKADERLEQGETVPLAPYNLRLTELDQHNADIGLAWQRPPGRLEGYLVLVRAQLQEWRTALQVVSREKSGAKLRLSPEIWGARGVELAVVSYTGELVSQPSNQLVLPPRLHTPLIMADLPSVPEEPLLVPPAPIETPPLLELEADTLEAGSGYPELAGWAEIEEALRRNSATLSRHGLFVNPNNQRF